MGSQEVSGSELEHDASIEINGEFDINPDIEGNHKNECASYENESLESTDFEYMAKESSDHTSDEVVI